uniref:Uncharacterized protein n=1 Tax=Arundo donax TaxID=35708 RepID=A0A0A9F7I5_ARUDO
MVSNCIHFLFINIDTEYCVEGILFSSPPCS